jgi:hypothetical protein
MAQHGPSFSLQSGLRFSSLATILFSCNASRRRHQLANIRVQQAAEHLGVSKSFLDKARIYGGGPAFMRFGRAIVYSTEELDRWAKGCTIANDNSKSGAASH